MGKKKKKKKKTSQLKQDPELNCVGHSTSTISPLSEILQLISAALAVDDSFDIQNVIEKLRGRLYEKSKTISSIKEELSLVVSCNDELVANNQELAKLLGSCTDRHKDLKQRHALDEVQLQTTERVLAQVRSEKEELLIKLKLEIEKYSHCSLVLEQHRLSNKNQVELNKDLSSDLLRLKSVDADNLRLREAENKLKQQCAFFRKNDCFRGVSHQFHPYNRESVMCVNEYKVLLSFLVEKSLARLLNSSGHKDVKQNQYRLFMVGSAVPGSPYRSVSPADVDLIVFCNRSDLPLGDFFSQLSLAFGSLLHEQKVVFEKKAAFDQVTIYDQVNGLSVDVNFKRHYTTANTDVFKCLAHDFPINPLCIELVLENSTQIVFGSLFHFSGFDAVLDVTNPAWFELQGEAEAQQERDALKKFAFLVKLMSRALFGVHKQTYRLSEKLLEKVRCVLNATATVLLESDLSFIRKYWRLVDSQSLETPSSATISGQIKRMLNYLSDLLVSDIESSKRLNLWCQLLESTKRTQSPNVFFLNSSQQQSLPKGAVSMSQESHSLAVSPVSRRGAPPGFGGVSSMSPG
jgi:hypothetical protein